MEKQARAVALAQQNIIQVQAQINDLYLRTKQEIDRLRELAQLGDITSQLMETSMNYRNELKRQIAKKNQELRVCKEKLEQEQRRLIEKEKAKRVFDKFKEKEQEQYEDDVRKTETKALDEIAGILRGHRFT